MKQIRLNQGNSSGQISPLLVAPLVGSFLEHEMDMKVCTKCGVPKLLSEFHKQKMGKYGVISVCKDCSKIYTRAYLIANRDIINDKQRKRRFEHKEERSAYKREYRQQFPERIKATNALNHAIRDGILIRPGRCSNPKCSKLCIPQGHHWSYKEEHQLDVIWSCHSCHKRIHITGQAENKDINWSLITPSPDPLTKKLTIKTPHGAEIPSDG